MGIAGSVGRLGWIEPCSPLSGMAVRSSPRFQIVFSPDARATLDRLPAEAQRRVLATCDALAERTALEPSPRPALRPRVNDLELVIDVVAPQQALWIRDLVPT